MCVTFIMWNASEVFHQSSPLLLATSLYT